MHASMNPPLGDLQYCYRFVVVYFEMRSFQLKSISLVVDVGSQLLHEGWPPRRDGVKLGLRNESDCLQGLSAPGFSVAIGTCVQEDGL